MTLNDFSYFLLMFDRVSLAAYVLFVIMLLSFYWVKHHFLRGAIFLVFLILALYAGRLEWIALPIIIVMGATFYYGFNGQRKFRRGLCFTLAILFSLAMLTMRIPGIENWRVIDKMTLTPDAIPYTMYLNFDKSLVGLFFIWFSAYSLANGGRWAKVLKKGCFAGLAAVLVLMPLSFALGYVKFDLKITSFFLLWAVHNLFFTCFAEEAFFRGMIQRFLQFRLQNVAYGKWISIVLAAMLFGAAHYPGGLRYVLLATVAGLFYGYAFMKTEKIEASIAAHFMVNTVHFVFFTYPALKSAM